METPPGGPKLAEENAGSIKPGIKGKQLRFQLTDRLTGEWFLLEENVTFTFELMS
jgi:hypothetical protein